VQPNNHMSRVLPLALAASLVGCMPQSGEPGPRAVLVVSSKDYPTKSVADALQSLRTLGPGIDKSRDTIDAGGKQIAHFSQYELAYWYPDNGSSVYGVALIKWVSNLNGPEAASIRDRYFVEVYSQDQSCALCSSVKESLVKHNVSFFSACDHPASSTEYEKVRCGT